MKRLVLLAAVAAATRRRVAVCFWGINRSLDLTLPSIQKHLLAPLADHDVELFFHTYTQKRASHLAGFKRDEAPVPGAVAELRALERVGTVTAWSATDQFAFDAAFEYSPFLRAIRHGSESTPTRRACATRTRGYLLAGSRTSCA